MQDDWLTEGSKIGQSWEAVTSGVPLGDVEFASRCNLCEHKRMIVTLLGTDAYLPKDYRNVRCTKFKWIMFQTNTTYENILFVYIV